MSTYYHGSPIRFEPGEVLVPAGQSRYQRQTNNRVYFTPDPMVAAAHVVNGIPLDLRATSGFLKIINGRAHLYEVEPIGEVEDDPEAVQAGKRGQSYMAPAARVVRRLDPEEAKTRMMATGSKKTAMDYWMGHRPDENGAPANDLLAPDPEQGVPIMPDDIYTRPEHYTGFRQMLPETMATLRAARGNPNAMVTIYRAQRTGTGLNTGDWVTLSKAYAEQDLASDPETDRGGRQVNTYRVPAHTVRYAGDDLMEWGYFGSPIRSTTAALQSEASDQDYSKSAMICLKPSEALRKVYADMDECTEDLDDLHITLYYLGEFGRDLQFEDQDLYYRGIYDFALHSGYRGLTGHVNGFGVFMNPDTNVLVALWDLPGIAEFRTRLMDYVVEHVGQVRQDNHSFTPHMTLAYSDDPFPRLPKLPRGNPEDEDLVSVWLVWGDDWTEVTLA